jgi:transcriptional regulator with XRE-family HTH domain
MKTLREWREARGFTQLDIAFGLGITPTTVANWETGRSQPRARYLRALADYLGVSMDDIDFGVMELKSAA